MACVEYNVNKVQREHPKRAELPDVNINTGVKCINSERDSSNTRYVIQIHFRKACFILLCEANWSTTAFKQFVIFISFQQHYSWCESKSQIDKPQRGRPKRAELPDVNINTGAQSINTESLFSAGSSQL